MEFLKSALRSLPIVASHPFAFIGYLFVIASWLVLGLKVKRNKQLLLHLHKLPARDRLEALRLEMGSVSIKSGLSPEQWLRSQIHRYYLIAFIVLCITFLVFITISIFKKTPSIDVDMGGASQPSTYRSNFDSEDYFKLRYNYERSKDKINVTYSMPYLTDLLDGQVIQGVKYLFDPFDWEFPDISVRVVNNTDKTLFLTEVITEVNSSTTNTDPVLIISETDYSVAHLTLVNKGWGRIIDPKLVFRILKSEDGSLIVKETEINLSTFDDYLPLSFIEYLPKNLIRDDDSHPFRHYDEQLNAHAQVMGKIMYKTDTGQDKVITFSASIALETVPAPSPGPPSAIYDLILESGKSGYTKSLPISEDIQPGKVSHFLVRIGTDRSSKFALSFSFRTSAGTIISGQDFIVDIFRPRGTWQEQTTAPKKLIPQRIWNDINKATTIAAVYYREGLSTSLSYRRQTIFYIYVTDKWIDLSPSDKEILDRQLNEKLRSFAMKEENYSFRFIDSSGIIFRSYSPRSY